MVILYQGERANIVAKEEDIKAGTKKVYAMFKNRLYDFGTWKNVANADDKLYGYVREELELHLNDALGELKKVETYFSTPAPVASPSPVGGKLEELLLKVIAEQSVEEIVKAVSPKLEQSIIDKFGVLPQIHEIKTPAGSREIKGTVHECFDKVLNLVNMDIPVFLSGAAGSTGQRY